MQVAVKLDFEAEHFVLTVEHNTKVKDFLKKIVETGKLGDKIILRVCLNGTPLNEDQVMQHYDTTMMPLEVQTWDVVKDQPGYESSPIPNIAALTLEPPRRNRRKRRRRRSSGDECSSCCCLDEDDDECCCEDACWCCLDENLCPCGDTCCVDTCCCDKECCESCHDCFEICCCCCLLCPGGGGSSDNDCVIL